MGGAVYNLCGYSANGSPKRFPDPLAPFRFLDLPREIRDQVYTLLLPERYIRIIRTHKILGQRILSPICGSFTTDEYDNNYAVSAPVKLLLICKQLKDEIIPLLYSRTMFHFGSMKEITRFLDCVSQQGLRYVKNIDIAYNSYGEPYLSAGRKWKILHDQRWIQACTRLASELPALRNLELSMLLYGWPIQLEPGAPWTRPLMILAGTGLDRVRLKITHHSFDKNRLRCIAAKMEDLMMTEQGITERDAEAALQAEKELQESKQKQSYSSRPPPVLSIPRSAVDNASAHMRPIFRTRGLEQFASIDLVMAGIAFL